MNYHFISDDSFFLLGIREVIKNMDVRAFFNNLNEERKVLNPQPGDIVVVAVNNVHLRSRLLRRPIMTRCRLMVMLDIPLTPSRLSFFPWLLPKSVGMEAFAAVLQKASRACVLRGEVTKSTLAIFEQLSSGKSAATLSGNAGQSVKKVYHIKRNVFQQYGLINCNSAGILVCRDMLGMKELI
ncbi:hypothetical protein [Entomohabitans teleogrylli]|uniref:hypothetical protein n=1 Tax=Entomohabitans teleogrylli TaxID=1384589 RepID=UPI00073D84E0|nr:hypothetical protein [Entomohabitans teleogrylli]